MCRSGNVTPPSSSSASSARSRLTLPLPKPSCSTRPVAMASYATICSRPVTSITPRLTRSIGKQWSPPTNRADPRHIPAGDQGPSAGGRAARSAGCRIANDRCRVREAIGPCAGLRRPGETQPPASAGRGNVGAGGLLHSPALARRQPISAMTWAALTSSISA